MAVATLMTATAVVAQVTPAQRHQLKSFSRESVMSRTQVQAKNHRFAIERQNGDFRQFQWNRKAQAPQPTEAIIDQPEGTLYENLKFDCDRCSYEDWSGVLYRDDTRAGFISLVEGNDGNIYIKGLLPSLMGQEHYWVKAERGEGDVFTIKPQLAGIYTYYDGVVETETIQLMQAQEFEDGSIWYVPAENPDIQLVYTGEGRLHTTDALNVDYEESPDLAIGIVSAYTRTNEETGETEDYNGWDPYCGLVWNVNVEPVTDVANELPAGVEAGTLIIQTPMGAGPIPGVFADGEVYFKLDENAPGWIKGVIDGDKVHVAAQQYLGISEAYGCHVYLGTATYVEESDDEGEYMVPTYVDEIVFDYDADARRMTAPGYMAILTQGKATNVDELSNFIFYVYDPIIYEFREVAAVPADPIIDNWCDWYDSFGEGELLFTIPTVDIDGAYINPDKLSYAFFVDDELYTFTADEYGLEADMTEVPYNFYDPMYNIANSWVNLYSTRPTRNVGLQSIYRGGGVENRSNIVWYDLTGSAIEQVGTSRTVQSEVSYDLAGRRVMADHHGMVIKVVTYTDGSQQVKKIISK